jgi:hypothetical protein
MKGRFIFGAVAALGLLMTTSQPAGAQGQRASHPNPVGTWLLEVTFLSGNPPPFKEMITLHSGGTVSETNATLNAASGLLSPPFNLIGSDRQGAWERLSGGMIGVSLTKLVFCGPASMAFCAPGIDFGPASATGFRLH